MLFAPLAVSAQQPAAVAKKKKGINMGVQPKLLRGPYLQVPTPTSVIVRWRTDVLSRSRVMYGLTPDARNMVADDSLLVMDHAVQLKNLKPSTKYYYTIGNIADTTLSQSVNNYFVTLPQNSDDTTYRIISIGDMGNGNDNQKKMRDALEQYITTKPIHAWITLGDNVYSDGTDAEFQTKFFDIYNRTLLPNYGVYLIPGNHDYHDNINSPMGETELIPYFKIFDMPKNGEAGGVPSGTKSYYSFDIGNVHFVALDSYGKDKNGKLIYDEGSMQMEWLKKDLAFSKDKKWKVVLIHHPPYTKGSHDSDKEKALVLIRQTLTPVIESLGADLVLSGHSHLYERSKLMKGYTGMEQEFDKKYEVSSSSGRYDGSPNSMPYIKRSDDAGTVYVVAGSGGQLSGVSEGYPHNAFFYSNNEIPGVLVLESKANTFTVQWLAADGTIKDRFTIMKNVSKKEEDLLKKNKTVVR